MPPLLGDVDLVSLVLRERGQGVGYSRQGRLDRLLILDGGLDHRAKGRDEVKPRPLIQRRNQAGRLLVDGEGGAGKERIARHRLLPQTLDGLEREKMCGYFDVIVGGEDVANHKPHPEGALKAVAALGAAASEVLYVGDSVVDAETARRAQLPFVAVLTGVTPRHAFTSYRPVAVVESLTAVPGLVWSNSARASQ